MILALVALVLAGMRLASRREAPVLRLAAEAGEVAAPVPVATMPVASSVIARTATLVGTVQASLTADLAPKVSGTVTAVTVREGDRVRAGQVLARLEAADLEAEVVRGRAGVAAARAALAQAETGVAIQKTQSATRVAQAEAALRAAREQMSLVREGPRRQEKRRADEAVRQAQAALEAARANLSVTREGARRQQKLQADAALRQAEAGARTAQATHDRYRALLDQGAVSQQQYDEIALQLEVARAALETARQQSLLLYEGARPQELQQAEEGVRQAEAALQAALAQRDLTYEGPRAQEIRQAEAQLRQAEEGLRMARAATDENRIQEARVRMLRAQLHQSQADLAAARVSLGYATIVAPFSGIVSRRHADPGALATPGRPILSVIDPSRFRFEAIVPERQISSVRLGAPVSVGIDALGRRLAGRVAQIVPAADPGSRSFLVKVGLAKAEGLSPGLFGRLRLPVGTTRGILVPESALWRAESLVGVVTVEDGVAHRRLVTTGAVHDGGVEVLSGLKPGEAIVTRDVDAVVDGAPVRAAGTAEGRR
jgi:RND family efflux transporter MFP subunit